MENEFPPNSHVKREVRSDTKPEKSEKNVVQVTRNKVMQRKKPLSRKFFEAFRPEDRKGFVEHVVLEVFLPNVRDAVASASIAAIENALGSTTTRRRSSGGSGFTSYASMGGSRGRAPREREASRRPERRPSNAEPREIILETRVEAEEVLEHLYEMLSKYDVATMRDLLSLVGEPYTFTDEDWGWRDLRGSRIIRIREGYLLDFPRPEALD